MSDLNLTIPEGLFISSRSDLILLAVNVINVSVSSISVLTELHLCNKTLGLARCPSGGCFEVKRKCDGIPDCINGFDESVCKLYTQLHVAFHFTLSLLQDCIIPVSCVCRSQCVRLHLLFV